LIINENNNNGYLREIRENFKYNSYISNFHYGLYYIVIKVNKRVENISC